MNRVRNEFSSDQVPIHDGRQDRRNDRQDRRLNNRLGGDERCRFQEDDRIDVIERRTLIPVSEIVGRGMAVRNRPMMSRLVMAVVNVFWRQHWQKPNDADEDTGRWAVEVSHRAGLYPQPRSFVPSLIMKA